MTKTILVAKLWIAENVFLIKPEKNTPSQRENVFSTLRFGPRVDSQKPEGLFNKFTTEKVSSNLDPRSRDGRLSITSKCTVTDSGSSPPVPAAGHRARHNRLTGKLRPRKIRPSLNPLPPPIGGEAPRDLIYPKTSHLRSPHATRDSNGTAAPLPTRRRPPKPRFIAPKH
jgi:hypothetical protein